MNTKLIIISILLSIVVTSLKELCHGFLVIFLIIIIVIIIIIMINFIYIALFLEAQKRFTEFIKNKK